MFSNIAIWLRALCNTPFLSGVFVDFSPVRIEDWLKNLLKLSASSAAMAHIPLIAARSTQCHYLAPIATSLMAIAKHGKDIWVMRQYVCSQSGVLTSNRNLAAKAAQGELGSGDERNERQLVYFRMGSKMIGTSKQKRDMKSALWRGFLRKCPNCGQGDLFDGYLSFADRCASCREDFSHHRTDDGPAWATIVIAGHALPPAVLAIYEFFESPNPIYVAIGLSLVFILLTLWLLPRIKGMFLSVQWANGMNGFGASLENNDAPSRAERE